jgi:phosphoglycolate phosphatase
MPALIVFDLDGTLVDSKRDLAESTNEMLAGYGAAPLPLDHVAGFVGEGARLLVRRALAAAGLDADSPGALDRFRDIYDRRLLNHTRPYAGVPELVRDLAGRARLAVLTNKPEAPSRRLLEAFDLAPHFASVIGGDSGVPRKPDPAGLRRLMDEAGAGADATVFVGDSMIDVETARNAGVRICVALYGFGRLRGELSLTGDELVAQEPADIARLMASAMRR